MSNTTALPSLVPVTSPRRRLHVGLWAAQLALAAVFAMSGGMKLAAPLAELQAQLPWVNGALGGAVRLIGLAELLGALGLVLPAATRILPWLTSLAAAGLATVMALAAATHVARGALAMLVVNGALGALAVFVAWGRARAVPIAQRALSDGDELAKGKKLESILRQ